MAQITSYDGTPIVDAIVIGPDGQPGYSQTAKLGEPGFSNVIVDDPTGSLTFETWKDWTVDEDDCTFERLYTGIVYAIRVDRGGYRDGPGRKWYLDIVDMGQLLKQRVISGADGQRPFEMDTVRINWLYNSDYLDALVFDNGFLNVTDNPQGQFDADHRFEYPMDVFVSVAGPISKHAFVYWDGVAEEPSIFYDRFDVSLGAAGIGFSNVMSDVDESTVFYPKVDAEATYDGEDRYGGLMLGWRGPSIYRQLASTVTDMGRVRDVTFQTDRIGLASTASSVTDLLLAQHADDLVSIKFSAELPSSVVNLARPGQMLEVRFEHIPGFETTQEVFIRSTIVQQIIAGRYLVQYDVAPNPTVPLVPTGGDPGDLPQVACDIPGNALIVQEEYESVAPVGGGPYSYTATWDTQPTAGNVLLAFFGHNTNSEAFLSGSTLAGWTLLERDAMATSGSAVLSIFWKTAGPSESTSVALLNASASTECFVALQEWSGVDTVQSSEISVQDSSSASGAAFIDLQPPDDTDVVLVGTLITNGGEYLNALFSTVEDHIGSAWGGADDDKFFVGHKVLANAQNPPSVAGDNTIAADFDEGIRWVSGGVVLTCTGSDECPATGQWVEDEIVTLTGADGTTRCPFADGSLHVYIDNVEQTETLVSQDGETGDFTLGFDPTPTEVCTVRYQGR